MRYEVGVDDLTSSEDPLAIRRYYRTDTPNLELPQPLQRDRLYSWSVTGYTEDGTQIASTYEPTFSTGRPKTFRSVSVRGIGVSTVLPTDWQQTAPGVFEYVDAEGEMLLTFEKRSRADLEAGLEEKALASMREFPQRYADREWGYLAENGVAKLVTIGSGNVYLITVNGLALTDEELTFPAMELLGIVIPTMLRNFKLNEQPSSTFKIDGQPVFAYEDGSYGVPIPHTPQDETDEQGTFIEVELQEEPENSKTLRRVKVRGVGVSTVLPTDWQQTAPGIFEYVDAAGKKSSLTFEKRPLAEVSFKADTLSMTSLPRYAGRDWEGVLLQDGQDSSLILTTEEGDSAYLVTVEGGEEQASLSVESYLDGLIPTMLRKFKLDEQP